MKIYITGFLLCLCSVMGVDYNVKENLHSLISYNHNIQTTSPMNPSECKEVLNEFAEASANFTRCSIKHARPVRLCAKCIQHYISFRDKYKELMTKNVNGTSCKSLFISHDRLDAVLEYHDNILAVWNKGNCNGCFDWDQDENPKLSENTLTFYKLFNETMDCIVDNVNPFGNNTKQVCEACMPKYIQLDEFYKNMSIDGIGVDTVCMDIVDSMNATRFIWSKVLDCCNLRRSPEIIFLCCTAIVALLPVLFYTAVRFCGPIRDLPNVLKQSRFKQIILRSSEQRIN